MKQLPQTLLFAFLLFTLTLSAHPASASFALAAEPGTKTAPEISEMLAQLDDQQVRQMLIDELKKDAQTEHPRAGGEVKGPASIIHLALKTLSSEYNQTESQLRTFWAGIPNILPNLKHVFLRLCPIGTAQGAVTNFLYILFFLAVGFVTEGICRYLLFAKYLLNAPGADSPCLGNKEKLISSLAHAVPGIIGLLIFFGAAYFSFMLLLGTDSIYVQLFFLSSLIAITAIRTVNIISGFIFSPSHLSFRIIPAQCKTAATIHHLLVCTSSYIIITLTAAVAIRRLGADIETIRLMQLGSASLLILTTAVACILYRNRVKNAIIDTTETEGHESSWGRQQFASIWHILAIAYLFTLWILLVNDMADPSTSSKGAFIPSFFVVPIWMIADRLSQWLLKHTMKTLQLHQEIHEDKNEPDAEEALRRAKGKQLYIKLKSATRIGVIAIMFIWIASLWDIHIPLFSELAKVLLDTLVIMTLAIFFWQFISSWIERKIAESIPEDEDEETDDEWGSTSSRGRAYTLLPMVRKFVGSILVVMVTMTTLSSMGVDIGPLLAGAGVIGLAIGFGAQKLVSDLFSGFFYLLDDAFRVGEYIEAGEVKGSVEAITLRNAMIRHHRGMLQIVPHSDLGTITNFMRGGIIVKFNLDFPYDAPIDKIRKIIKKVGQRMLQNEEYGKDFIRPVKSQGVREITNSVMTIRVKFTAQPGTHFVIRREAYRLITEALNAQGIFYAHRKVIVDLPETTQANGFSTETKQQVAHAAGAAAMRAVEEEEKQSNQPS